MKYVLISFASILILGLLFVFFYSLKSKNILKIFLFNSLLGIFALISLNLTQKYTGIYIPYNWYTVAGSGLYGIPGVCGLLFLKIIFL